MNDIKKEFFISNLANEKETIEDKIIYNISPIYGSGTFIMYKIIKGMYLAFNNLKINNTIINRTNSTYCSPLIKIDYCIDGNYVGNCPNDKVCIANKGNTTYYAGTTNFMDVDFKGKRYKSICIICYLNEITDSIKELLGVSKEKIEIYYEKLFNRKKIFVVETDIDIISILKELQIHIKSDNVELIKLKAIELFLLEISKYEDYKNKEKEYYARSTVNKVECIKDFIEENVQEHFSIDSLSKKFDISTTNLKKCFKYVYGMGTYTYLKKYRMEKACQLLLVNSYNILEVANMVGYSNQSKFSSAFKEYFGVTPLKYKKKVLESYYSKEILIKNSGA